MVMTVHERALTSGKFGEAAALQQSHAMRATVARRSLLVFDRFGQFGTNVLDECAAARDVQNLHPETDRQEWSAPPLNLFKDERIRLVFQRMYAADLWL